MWRVLVLVKNFYLPMSEQSLAISGKIGKLCQNLMKNREKCLKFRKTGEKKLQKI